MGLDEHFNTRDEVKKEGQASQVDAGFAPALDPVEDGRKNGNSGRCVEDCRKSKPKKVHSILTLLVQTTSIL
jgi:hypothetical protein